MMEIQEICCDKNKIQPVSVFLKNQIIKKKINTILSNFLKNLVCKTGLSDFNLVLYLLFNTKNKDKLSNFLNSILTTNKIRIYQKNIKFSSKSEKSIHYFDLKNIENKETGFYNIYDEKKLYDKINGITFFFSKKIIL